MPFLRNLSRSLNSGAGRRRGRKLHKGLERETERSRERKREEMAIGAMTVVLVKANGLENKDFLCRMDPYVVMQYKGQERKSSVAAGQGSNPQWNEKLTFTVRYPGSGESNKLVLKIMDKDVFSADDFVGQTTIYVKDLISLGVENGFSELPAQKYRVVREDQSYFGDIEVGISFTRKKEEEDDAEEIGGWKQSHFN